MKFGLHYLLSCADSQSPVQRYSETIEQATRAEAGHPPSVDGDGLTLLMPLYVGADRRRIEQDVAPSVRQIAETAAAAFASLVAKAPEAERPKLQAMVEQLCGMTYQSVNAVTGIFDTPSACIERLQQVREELNPGRVICWFNFGGLISHADVMRSMELFSNKVLPHV